MACPVRMSRAAFSLEEGADSSTDVLSTLRLLSAILILISSSIYRHLEARKRQMDYCYSARPPNHVSLVGHRYVKHINSLSLWTTQLPQTCPHSESDYLPLSSVLRIKRRRSSTTLRPSGRTRRANTKTLILGCTYYTIHCLPLTSVWNTSSHDHVPPQILRKWLHL